jgi:plastocyanin
MPAHALAIPARDHAAPRRSAGLLVLAALVAGALGGCAPTVGHQPLALASVPTLRHAPVLVRAAAPAAPSEAAATHRVRMMIDADGRYRFEPASITIAPGDRVTWVMVSGAPHNVQFVEDSVPAAAKARLAANMPDPMSELMGPMLMNDNETYTIPFDGIPAGTYKYVCTPHLAMDMTGTIIVRSGAKRPAAAPKGASAKPASTKAASKKPAGG